MDEISKWSHFQPQKKSYWAHPYNRPGGKRPDLRRTEQKKDIHLYPFNYTSQSVKHLQELDLSQIFAVEISPAENRTIYVQTEEGAFCINGRYENSRDYFLNRLAKCTDVRVPEVRLIRASSEQFIYFIREIERAVFSDKKLWNQVKTIINVPVLQIMEYIPGLTLDQMGPERAQKCFSRATPSQLDSMIRLGFIIAYDTLLCNNQRYPFLPSWTGAQQNIKKKLYTGCLSTNDELFDKKGRQAEFDQFYAMNTQMEIRDLNNQENLLQMYEYFQQLDLFLDRVFIDLDNVRIGSIEPLYETGVKRFESLKSISDFIESRSGYRLKEMEILQIAIGIGLWIDNICQFGADKIMLLRDHFRMIGDQQDRHNMQSEWNKGLDTIDIKIFYETLQLYLKFRSVYARVIEWLKETTFGQYTLDPNVWYEMMGIQADTIPMPVLDVGQASQMQSSGSQRGDDSELNERIKQLMYVDLPYVEEQFQDGTKRQYIRPLRNQDVESSAISKISDRSIGFPQPEVNQSPFEADWIPEDKSNSKFFESKSMSQTRLSANHMEGNSHPYMSKSVQEIDQSHQLLWRSALTDAEQKQLLKQRTKHQTETSKEVQSENQQIYQDLSHPQISLQTQNTYPELASNQPQNDYDFPDSDNDLSGLLAPKAENEQFQFMGRL